ncbi:MAG TPA: CRISPR-associated endoribonuclease Cas6 [Syntrophaceae bacterium]|nr:CRISPR-associated endoribonuclease Cas6 [Syntrophaceae bacterium]
MTPLASLVLVLRPEEDLILPATLGNFGHACFLEIVSSKDKALTEELHSDKKDKPFTVSLLQGEFTSEGKRLLASRGKEYWMRITSLNNNLSQLLLNLDEKTLNAVAISDGRFEIVKIAKEAGGHAWAKSATYEDLYNQRVAEGKDIFPKIRLKFYSPTTFRSQGQNIPLPLPRLVFYGLAQKWNRYSPIFLGDDIAEIAEKYIHISRYKLRTHMLDFGNYRQVGFTGECEFLLKKYGDDIWQRIIHLLCDFAFYAGIGYKTTMGMGQVRRMPTPM